MRTFLIFAFAAVVTLAPVPVFAQFGPIVPEACHSCPCGFGGVLAIIQNLVNFVIALAIIIGTIIIAWGGFLYILSPANPGNRSLANKMLINAVIGLVITLSAWLIVDFVMKTLYGGQFGPWNSILYGDASGNSCIEANPPKSLFSGGIFSRPGASDPVGTNPGTVTTAGGCTGSGTNSACVSLSPDVRCEASGCKVDSGLRAALAAIQSPVGWAVTEGYPPSRSHRALCHSNGTCVDVGLRPRTYTVETVTAFYNAARAAGLRPVFESKNQTFVNQLTAQGVNALYLGDHISADHFSVYAR